MMASLKRYLLREKVIFLIKSLPKTLRRHFIPVPKFADDCLRALSADDGALMPALSEQLRKLTSIEIKESDWNLSEMPIYLQMNFKLVDDQGDLLAESRDLHALKLAWAKQAEASFRQIPDSDYERQGLTAWSFGDLNEHITLEQNGLEMTAYPALIDKTDCVDLTLMDTLTQAQTQTSRGLRRLFMLAQPDAVKYLNKHLPDIKQMCLYYANVPPAPFNDIESDPNQTPSQQLKSDLIHVTFDRCFLLNQPPIRSQHDFEQRLNDRKSELIKVAGELAKQVSKPLAEYHAIAKRLSGSVPLTAMNAIKDIKQQLEHLLYQGFIHNTPDEALNRLPMYFQAIGQRLDKLNSDPARDKQWLNEITPYWNQYLNNVGKINTAEFIKFRWMLEELRISLFAQGIKTPYPISTKRIDKQWALC
jgi:ATP-dependent helicase HrpA